MKGARVEHHHQSEQIFLPAAEVGVGQYLSCCAVLISYFREERSTGLKSGALEAAISSQALQIDPAAS